MLAAIGGTRTRALPCANFSTDVSAAVLAAGLVGSAPAHKHNLHDLTAHRCAGISVEHLGLMPIGLVFEKLCVSELTSWDAVGLR